MGLRDVMPVAGHAIASDLQTGRERKLEYLIPPSKTPPNDQAALETRS